MTDPELLSFWMTALQSPPGSVIQTTSPEGLRQQLYAFRRKHYWDYPQLENLFIAISRENPDKEILILHKEIQVQRNEPPSSED